MSLSRPPRRPSPRRPARLASALAALALVEAAPTAAAAATTGAPMQPEAWFQSDAWPALTSLWEDAHRWPGPPPHPVLVSRLEELERALAGAPAELAPPLATLVGLLGERIEVLRPNTSPVMIRMPRPDPAVELARARRYLERHLEAARSLGRHRPAEAWVRRALLPAMALGVEVLERHLADPEAPRARVREARALAEEARRWLAEQGAAAPGRGP